MDGITILYKLLYLPSDTLYTKVYKIFYTLYDTNSNNKSKRKRPPLMGSINSKPNNGRMTYITDARKRKELL
jgi:peptide subunit release factor 1 (eRF1)